MKKVRVSDLNGAELDWAVAQAEGITLKVFDFLGAPYFCADSMENDLPEYSPSRFWEQGGPLVERHEITVIRDGDEWWAGLYCQAGDGPGIYMEYGQVAKTYLTAACQVIIAKKFGDYMEVPEDPLQR